MSTLSSSASATDAGVDTTSGGRSLLFLAYNNPNYTAQVITVSIDWKWQRARWADGLPGPGLSAECIAALVREHGVKLAAFPDVHSNFNRVDVEARYKFERIQQAGMKLEPYMKLRYLWERNSTDDWAPLSWNYMYNFNAQTSAAFAKGIMLGWDNPNYNIQAVMLSAGVKW